LYFESLLVTSSETASERNSFTINGIRGHAIVQPRCLMYMGIVSDPNKEKCTDTVPATKETYQNTYNTDTSSLKMN